MTDGLEELQQYKVEMFNRFQMILNALSKLEKDIQTNAGFYRHLSKRLDTQGSRITDLEELIK